MRALRDKKIIINRSKKEFRDDQLVYLLYADFMAFSLERAGVAPQITSLLFSWFGTEEYVYSIDYGAYIIPHVILELLVNSEKYHPEYPKMLSLVLINYFD